MRLTLLLAIMLLAALKMLYNSITKPIYSPQTAINKEWWDGLSQEWKTILIINQNFQQQNVNIFTLQREYINRSHTAGEAEYSEMNTSLHEWNKLSRFELGYADLYERAIRRNHLLRKDGIDLLTLGNLDTLYMVNGPGDLTPLEKFPHLKVLILNYCGIDVSTPTDKQALDVAPLKYLKELKVLHCSSIALQSLTPLKDLVKLEELRCDNSNVTSLAPIKNMVNLKRLSFGPKVLNAFAISHLANLEELYLAGCKQVPDLSRLKKLKKLSVSESELAIVDARYRMDNLAFLKKLTELEFLDLNYTSYKGNLAQLYGLPRLKAVTLPPVSSSTMMDFKKASKECEVINSFEFER